VSVVNGLLRPLVDLLLSPFRALPPAVGLVVVSAVAAVGMLLVYKRTSNQPKLDAVKRQIHACLFEIRLFSDDLPAILRAQAEILGHNVRYLGLSLVPMLWMLVPLVLVIAQLQFHYGYEGLKPGQDFLLKLRLRDGWAADAGSAAGGASARPPARLEVPAGVTVETPAVWIPTEREVAWRLRAREWGDYSLKLQLGSQEYAKAVQVSSVVRRRSPVRLAAGFLNELLYPAEEPLPRAGPLESITIAYPEASVSFFGFGVNWLVAFVVLSVAFAFALRKPFGVVM